MKAFEDMKHFVPAEKLVRVLMQKTQNKNPLFFRLLVAYSFCKIASMMRIGIKTHDRGVIPVSMYVMNLATSGSGKGFSTNIVEEQVTHKFRKRFLETTFLEIAEQNLAAITVKRALKYDVEEEDMKVKVDKEFDDLGHLAFSFDSATTAALKQMRHKLLMADAGSVNLEIDEIGSNLLGNGDVLTAFLELFDVGKIKQKLIKNTSENKRSEEIDGRTPTNLLMYGEPDSLLNGDKEEHQLIAMLTSGYARRCFFGYCRSTGSSTGLTAEEVYTLMTDTTSVAYLATLANQIGALADKVNFKQELTMTKTIALLLIEYKLNCERRAEAMRSHEGIAKAEVTHRYYKVLKLAGAYAFIDGSHEILESHVENAIKVAEESGEAFAKIMTRERNYEKLAKYVATIGREITQVDLVEDLPFYKGSESHKKELMNLAIAFGYRNNIVIKRTFSEGIEFFEGESMEVTDLDKMIISCSTDIALNYGSYTPAFDKLHQVVCKDKYHYAAHHFLEGRRLKTHMEREFNLAIIDVDSGISIDAAKELLKEYKCLFATTKSHTSALNRFRIIMPLSHTVKLNADSYAEFMVNLFNWLPFDVDESTKDGARKWRSHPGQHWYQDGELLDATLFIPQTKKAEEQVQRVMDSGSLNNLERWFCHTTTTGNRSNQLIKYAMILVDSGYSVDAVRNSVMAFNNKLKDGLNEEEIQNTIMSTVTKKIAERE